MSNLVDNTSDNDLNIIENNYLDCLADLKKHFPKYEFYNDFRNQDVVKELEKENINSFNTIKGRYSDASGCLDLNEFKLNTAITKLDEKTTEINDLIKQLTPNKKYVTKKDVLTPEQMINDKVDIYNFHKLNIFIRVVGIAGLLFLFKLKFKGTLKNPLASSNSASSNSVSSNNK